MKNESKIKCPNCHTEIDVQDVLAHQLEAEFKKSYDAKLVKVQEQFDGQSKKLADEKATFEEKKRKENELFQERFEKKLKEEKAELQIKLKAKIEEEQAEEFKLLQTELNEKSEKVKELNRSKAEIEKLIDDINSFLEKLDDFNLEERRVLEVLGLDDDMTFWKKRVVQMDQDLKFNLKFMEESKRVDRIEEIYSEIDEIKENIVLNVIKF